MMTTMLDKREGIKRFYAQHERILVPFFKFILSACLFFFINSTAGALQKWSSWWVVLILSLIMAFLPYGLVSVICGFMMVWGFSKISMELALVTLFMLLLMFLMFFHLSSKNVLVVLLVPLAFFLKVPEVIPVFAGLLGGTVCVIPIAFGTVIFYLLTFARLNGAAIMNMEEQSNISRITYFFNQIFMNKEMYLWIIMLVVVSLFVFILRRSNINHSWTLAVIVGTVAELLVILAGGYIMDTDTDILFLVLGCILAILAGLVLELFFMNADYSRIEYVQFEDDEYYYYVKAVPKMYVSAEDKVVKKINTHDGMKKKKVPGKDTEEMERMLDESYGK